MASAPGKLVLFGEHAVVYGYPAIVCAIDKRISAIVQDGAQKGDIFETGAISDQRFVRGAVKIFKHQFKVNTHVIVQTSSQFSAKVGFGSSSAVVVATLFALAKHFNKPISKNKLFNLAYEVVLSIQKNGSGIDVAAAIWGGVICFQKNTSVQTLSSTIENLIIGYTGQKANTAELINKVREMYMQNPNNITHIFEAIGEVVLQAKNALIKRDVKTIGKLMVQNHSLLKHLGISTDKLDHLVEVACLAGAYGAKLSGAGGGDCTIALASDKKVDKLVLALKSEDADVYQLRIEQKGVLLHI